jgi:hypothetical protein
VGISRKRTKTKNGGDGVPECSQLVEYLDCTVTGKHSQNTMSH